jgi:hypothetical protein
MGLLYWDLILEALSFYGKKKFGPYLKKNGLKLKKKKKKIGLIKIFLDLIKKHFGPYLLGALGDGLSGLAIGPALRNT